MAEHGHSNSALFHVIVHHPTTFQAKALLCFDVLVLTKTRRQPYHARYMFLSPRMVVQHEAWVHIIEVELIFSVMIKSYDRILVFRVHIYADFGVNFKTWLNTNTTWSGHDLKLHTTDNGITIKCGSVITAFVSIPYFGWKKSNYQLIIAKNNQLWTIYWWLCHANAMQ